MPDLYLKFARLWVPRSRYLDFFHFVNAPGRVGGVPSWCPTFDPQRATSFAFRASEAQYRAGFNGKEASIKLLSEPRQLEVIGFEVDKIAKVSKCT
jgi:hypothetical protein